MRAKLLRHNTISESRLLIRSQSLLRGLVGSGRLQRFMPAVQTAKGDSKSHNISHNTPENQGGRYGSDPRKRSDVPSHIASLQPAVPDLYADSKIFWAWRFAA